MRAARELDPEQKMLVLTSFDDDAALRESRAMGAAGLMLKSARSKEIVEAILAIHGGGSVWPSGGAQDELELSESDRRIVELIGEGHSNREKIGRASCREREWREAVAV